MAKKEVTQPGTCYLCGEKFTQADLIKHIRKTHIMAGDGEACLLLKVEGADNPDYWLLLDMPANCKLSVLDAFLRRIWLECCGHISAFRTRHEYVISMNRQIGTFNANSKIQHDYAPIMTTTLSITVLGVSTRPKQRDKVRLLARNDSFVYTCNDCGQLASLTAETFDPDYRRIYMCEDCVSAMDPKSYNR